jgi:RNA polymerase sigma-70 factor (ECF subfamily)
MEPLSSSAEVEYEIALLRRVGEGDRRSFEEIYERYSGVLYSTALRVLNEETAAEDVIQDVFVQIWEKASLYDPLRGKPLTWAITLTRNKAIDRLRSLQRRNRVRDQMEAQASIFEEFSDKSSLDELDSVEKGVIIRKAILDLSQDQRKAIELAFFSGMSQSEIAEALNEPLGTIKARIRRGMMKLKDIVTPQL